MSISFAAVTPENSQRILMNDNLGRVSSEEWITAKGSLAMWYAINCYAAKNNIDKRDVGYACRPLKENADTPS